MSPFDFQYKMVIAVRTDLKLSKGNIALQVALAAIKATEEAKRKQINWLKSWYNEGQKKVVVQVKSDEEIEQLARKASISNFSTAIIQNTTFENIPLETKIAVAIGPAPNVKLNKLTNELKLL